MATNSDSPRVIWLIPFLAMSCVVSFPALAAPPTQFEWLAGHEFACATHLRTGNVLAHLVNNVVVSVSKEEIVFGSEFDDDVQSATAWRAQLVAGTFDDFAYGGLSPIVVKARLDAHLHRKIFEIDRACGLTDNQWKKLKLAGIGDMKRFFDDVAKVETRFRTYHEVDDVEGIEEWLKEMKTLHSVSSLIRNGDVSPFFCDGSLFSKTLRRLLTAEQASKWRGTP